jgi:hypothetical protein
MLGVIKATSVFEAPGKTSPHKFHILARLDLVDRLTVRTNELFPVSKLNCLIMTVVSIPVALSFAIIGAVSVEASLVGYNRMKAYEFSSHAIDARQLYYCSGALQ